PARTISYVSDGRPPFAERLSQGGKMKTEAGFLHGEVPPGYCDQILLAHDLGSVLDKNEQNVEGAPAQMNRNAPLKQPLCHEQTERAKSNHILGAVLLCVQHGALLQFAAGRYEFSSVTASERYLRQHRHVLSIVTKDRTMSSAKRSP